MRRWCLVFVLSCAACTVKPPTTTPPPPPPVTGHLSVHLFSGDPMRDEKIPAAAVAIDDGATFTRTATTGGAGDVGFDAIPFGHVRACSSPAGFVAGCVDVQFARDNQDVDLSLARAVRDCGPLTWTGIEARCSHDGQPWRWRYATGFALLARLAHGDVAGAEAYLAWLETRGFTGARILTTLHGTVGDLTPAAAQAALPDLFARLKAHGLGAELVALADTGSAGLSRDAMRQHVQALGQLAAAADVPLTLELANENAHPTQQRDLQDLGFLRELRGLVPASLHVSLGSTCCGQPDTLAPYQPGGDYITLHLDRSRPTWQEVVRLKHYRETSDELHLFVVDDEPIGAAEVEDPGRRTTNVDRFFAAGAEGRFFGLGSTFHCTSCIDATVPGPVQDACARAFIAGATLVPDDAGPWAFYNDSAGGGMTRGADWSHVFKVFSFDGPGGAFSVALGVDGDPSITFVNGWRVDAAIATRPGVTVSRLTR